MSRSHLGWIIPWQQVIDTALLVAVDDGGERSGQIGLRIDGVEFAGLDERGDCRPVFGPGVVACEECVLAVQRNRPDGSFDTVVVELDAAVSEEETQPVPVFGDVIQSLAERRFGSDAGTVMDEPCFQVGDHRF